LFLLLVACARTRTPHGEVRLHLEAEPPHLNPLLGGDAVGIRITLGDVYEPLWRMDDQGVPAPVLAASFTRSPDDREWTFVVRDRVKWHDGRPLVPEDVAETLKRLAPGGLQVPLAADFDDLELIEIVEPRSVRLRFRETRVGRDRSLARVPILPSHVPLETLARAPVGTGPFAFEGWDRWREIRFRNFAGYWGRPAHLARVVYRIISDRANARAQLRAGQLDLLMGASPAEVAEAGDAKVVPYEMPTFSAVVWNLERGKLGDPRVRRALGQLLDRPTISREVFGGRARLWTGPWSPDDPATDPAVPALAFDPARAKAALAEAGAAPLRVTLLYPASSRQSERVLTIWKADAARVGVELVLDPQPFDEVLRRTAGRDFDGVALSYPSEREQEFYDFFHSSRVSVRNNGGFSDPEVDRLLDEIRTTVDPSARHALEHRLHKRLAELQPLTILFGDFRAALVSPRLQGLKVDLFDAGARNLEVRR